MSLPMRKVSYKHLSNFFFCSTDFNAFIETTLEACHFGTHLCGRKKNGSNFLGALSRWWLLNKKEEKGNSLS